MNEFTLPKIVKARILNDRECEYDLNNIVKIEKDAILYGFYHTSYKDSKMFAVMSNNSSLSMFFYENEFEILEEYDLEALTKERNANHRQITNLQKDKESCGCDELLKDIDNCNIELQKRGEENESFKEHIKALNKRILDMEKLLEIRKDEINKLSNKIPTLSVNDLVDCNIESILLTYRK